MATPKIPDGLTVRLTTNARDKTTRIVAYRKGRFKYAYKAILPMCDDATCRQKSPHVLRRHRGAERALTHYHQSDVDSLVGRLVKSYR